jgi:hypothetical protein
MSKIRILIILGAVLILGGVIFYVAATRPSIVTVKVVLSGSEGLGVAGKCRADGREFDIEKKLPAQINMAAKRLCLTIGSTDETATFFAEVFVDETKRVAGGGTRMVQIDVSGPTLFSPSNAFLKAMD